MNDTYSRFTIGLGVVLVVLGALGSLLFQRTSMFSLTVTGIAVIAIGLATRNRGDRS